MSADERLDRVLDAAYTCFVRHGVRKTTMDDIAAAAGMSRPAVYQYVRNKEDVFRRVVARILARALDEARTAGAADGTLAQRMDRILTVRLRLTQRAADLLGDGARISADLQARFTDDLADLLTETIADAASQADLPLSGGNAREVAELALALTRGLEVETRSEHEPDRPRERLRNGIALLVAGVAAATKPRP